MTILIKFFQRTNSAASLPKRGIYLIALASDEAAIVRLSSLLHVRVGVGFLSLILA